MTKATADIWQEFSRQLHAFVVRHVSDPADADDLLQEIFVKIHTHLNTVRDGDRLVSWLYRIARNAITDHYRTRKELTAIPETLAQEELPEKDLTSQLAAGLRHLIECLPSKYRQALLLTEIEGLTQQEMAKRLGLSLSGAKSRVQRGRHLLRAALSTCCHFEFDRRGTPIDYTVRPDCCLQCNILPDQMRSPRRFDASFVDSRNREESTTDCMGCSNR